MESVLKISGLTKRFGRLTAVNSLDLEIPKGSVFGLLGPNGSGKSTTLGMVLGVVNPTGGRFEWLGKGSGHHIRRQIGAIIENPSFYSYLSAYENLRVVCRIKKVDFSRIDYVLQRVSLFERRDDAFSTFSLGMKQRLAIASALLPDPEVMILDEPTNGLDPEGIAEIRELIQSLAEDGRTIVLASHLLDEVQKICSHFCVLNRGKKVYQGSVQELLQSSASLKLRAEKVDELGKLLNESNQVEQIVRVDDYFKVKLKETATSGSLNQELIEKKMVLSELAIDSNSLEKKFLEILNTQAR